MDWPEVSENKKTTQGRGIPMMSETFVVLLAELWTECFSDFCLNLDILIVQRD